MNFAALNPRFVGSVTDFGSVLLQFNRDSKLSLLSYGSHWALVLEDVEHDDRSANVFLSSS